ncbi:MULTISPECIES: VIT1/CCC1 transporter family protein [unclassified Haloferax]|uniref:VIT1/CCC1 transporter family protein n=1 Tax=unclassified Haloferax TaxID=2625095 RepID=UPI00287626E6|nr:MULTISPECIES: VIT1/CCC1 transporter family protein [unclassified Haloferax]MDS0243488.1 VIT1/CCC1 transporter family protein [Haloferax sp. S2CR25]MDS0446609.1 VIT1/CCC1 transporter family protein [Haloferax sp. S2CR25-2]
MLETLLGDDVESSGRYLPELIYGANDGIVTTFAVVAGVAGASLSPGIVIVLGFANLFADGFSMGMSNYLAERSEEDYHDARGDGHARTDGKTPVRTAAATFAAFIVAGWAPLFPYVLRVEPLFPVSIAVTAAAFFAVGASRSLVTNRSWLANGVEMFVVGMAAATVAYAVGNLLAGVA